VVCVTHPANAKIASLVEKVSIVGQTLNGTEQSRFDISFKQNREKVIKIFIYNITIFLKVARNS
jgi:hypothetical protein